jgi:hypothetical protein
MLAVALFAWITGLAPMKLAVAGLILWVVGVVVSIFEPSRLTPKR